MFTSWSLEIKNWQVESLLKNKKQRNNNEYYEPDKNYISD